MICMFFDKPTGPVWIICIKTQTDTVGQFYKKERGSRHLCFCMSPIFGWFLFDSIEDGGCFPGNALYFSQLGEPLLINGVIPIGFHKNGATKRRFQFTADK